MDEIADKTVPRENLYRAQHPADFELRAAADGMPTMAGHFAIFDEWTEIDSVFEGNFLERIAPGAFAKTFAENRSNIRVLLEHGYDPQVGNKPLGRATKLTEDGRGAYYEVPLLDTSYNRDLVPALDSGQYGASFRFRVVKEEFDTDPGVSEHNPHGIPERTIKEAHVMEFGPVTFPAYSSATAGLRSITDDIVYGLRDPERRAAVLRALGQPATPTDLPEPAEATRTDAKPAEATSQHEPMSQEQFLRATSEKEPLSWT